MGTRLLTASQALVNFLKNQYVERDGVEHRFFAGCAGIFGHGIVAGLGQALHQTPDFPYFQGRNEQAIVHMAVGYAKMRNRLGAFACTSSIGPGSTNLVTGAAGATVNRLPVLLLPSDIFARRTAAPHLQAMESEHTLDISVNDCLKPISRYWDRIYRPEQLIAAVLHAMRVLTSPADTGAVTLCLPQDVQAEAYRYPEELFAKRVWTIPRTPPDRAMLQRAAEWIRRSKTPLIVAGGGCIYSEATEALSEFARSTGIPVAETHAGKGSLDYQHDQSVGTLGVTGAPGGNRLARDADLVVGIGARYTDFTTSSKTAFQHPDVRFININVAEVDAHKHNALPLVADARATLDELSAALSGFRVSDEYAARVAELRQEWDAEVERYYHPKGGGDITQAEVIGAVNSFSGPHDVVVCASGSLTGDLHKLWRTRDPKGYQMEHGYSTMGYEIAGGLGAKMAAPDREVYVLMGDGCYLMMSSEILTSVQEGIKLTIVLLDNHGFASINRLSHATGGEGFGTEFRSRGEDGQLSGDYLSVDYAASARALGANAVKVDGVEQLRQALVEAKQSPRTTLIVVEPDPSQAVRNYDAWWDVPMSEVSERATVAKAREEYEGLVKKQRYYL